jgi:hypothetical protein
MQVQNDTAKLLNIENLHVMATHRNDWTKSQENQTISQIAIGRRKCFFATCCGIAELLRLNKIHAGRKQGNEDLKYVVNIQDKFNIFVHMS